MNTGPNRKTNVKIVEINDLEKKKKKHLSAFSPHTWAFYVPRGGENTVLNRQKKKMHYISLPETQHIKNCFR